VTSRCSSSPLHSFGSGAACWAAQPPLPTSTRLRSAATERGATLWPPGCQQLHRPLPPPVATATAMAHSLPAELLRAIFSAVVPPAADVDEVSSPWSSRTVLSFDERVRAEVGAGCRTCTAHGCT